MTEAMDEFPEFIRALPEIDLPFPNCRGWLMQGGQQQTVFVEFPGGLEMPEHTHAEQWEFPLAGKVTLHRGGTSTEYLPGDNFFVPADEPHGATVAPGYKAMMIFNCPDRYRPKK